MFLQRQQKKLRARLRFLRHRIPYWLIWRVLRWQNCLLNYRAGLSSVSAKSSYENIYYGATIKSGSQWLTALFSDFTVYRYSGLPFYDYLVRYYKGREPRPTMTGRPFDKAFPVRKFAGTLYIDYSSFQTIPKPSKWRAFFVIRDPRDLLVSWYFSAKISHIVIGSDTVATRRKLESLSFEDGLIYGIDWFAEYGLFQSLKSWHQCDDPNVKTIRYEDLVSDRQPQVFRDLFNFLDINIPEDEFQQLLQAYSFETLSGRKPGEADNNSHIRQGQSGNWQKHFTPKVREHWDRVVGDLAEELGYSVDC